MPDAYSSYERAYNGLETFYVMQSDYAGAAGQVRALLDYYPRTYADEPNLLFNLEQPTAMRLAQHLMVARRRAEAREVYTGLLDAAVARGESGRVIEDLIGETYKENVEVFVEEPTARKALSPPRSNFYLVPPPDANRSEPNPTSSEFRAEHLSAGDIRERIRGMELEGVYLEKVEVAGEEVELEGYAADNPTVAELLRQLDSTVGRPQLQAVIAADREGRQVSTFKITVSTDQP